MLLGIGTALGGDGTTNSFLSDFFNIPFYYTKTKHDPLSPTFLTLGKVF